MNELVRVRNNDIFTDSLVIANETGNEHESIVAHLKKYPEDFKELGEIEFTDLKSGKRGRPTRVYVLNEPQASLLITYLDNNEIVRAFKVRLVKEFYRMRQFIMQHSTAEWQQARQQSKSNRLRETDEIKAFIEYCKNCGSKNAENYYATFTKLVNTAVGIQTKQRDSASYETLQIISLLENTIRGTIADELKKETEYHQIYYVCKEKVSGIMALVYLPEQKLLFTA